MVEACYCADRLYASRRETRSVRFVSEGIFCVIGNRVFGDRVDESAGCGPVTWNQRLAKHPCSAY
jgi:hypothetical protein